MDYWIICLPREDMEHCIKIGTFGLNKKHNMGNVKAGDRVIFYVTKECKIIALGEATSDYFMDDKRIFLADGVFPDRFDINAKLLGAKNEIDFKSIVDDLTFIGNKLYWSAYLRAGIAQIPKQDWELVQNKVGAGVK